MESENQPVSAGSPLRRLLRNRRAAAHVADAELIRDYSDCLERTTEAERLIREMMFDFTLGVITDEERSRIFEILAFAIPPLPEYLANPDPAPWIAERP